LSPDHQRLLKALEVISLPPRSDGDGWFENGRQGVDFLVQNALSDEVVLYANFGFTVIHGLLAPEANLSPPDFDELENCHVSIDASWILEHVSGGGKPDRMYLASALNGRSCRSLDGGEKLIFERVFRGVDKEWRKIELSQQMIHALDLYWMDELDAFCRLTADGDIEPVVRLAQVDCGDRRGWIVTILATELHRYMAVTETALVRKFDFTRTTSGFGGWDMAERDHVRRTDISYHSGVQHAASFFNGVQVLRSRTTRAKLIEAANRESRREGHQYASFIALNVKHGGRVEELSCAPRALASYFEPESPLPFQITPAFFRPEVLQKYKADPDKYSLEHRSVSCRGGWCLQTYDVNEQGQVHTYLRYLGHLPYSEQLYWKSFNEAPKGTISRRAYENDILGAWTTVADPLDMLKALVRELDDSGLSWWKPRGDALLAVVHYPVSTSREEWANALLALDQLVVEGFIPSVLLRTANERGVKTEPGWKSLKILAAMVSAASDAAKGADFLKPLRELNDLRSKVKGHATGAARDELSKTAIKEAGSLKQHFENLAGSCFASLKMGLALAFQFSTRIGDE
jgi:hypothetical protein